jgi:hypothetical protein
MSKSNKIPEAYTVSKSDPPMVKYIERTLLDTPLWLDWVVLKSLMMSFTVLVRERTGVTSRRAQLMIWNAFVAAIEGDARSPVVQEIERMVKSLTPEDRPIFIARSQIAASIHKGQSRKIAEAEYLEWLAQDENNVFGDYRLQEDFTTVSISSDSE